MDIAETLRRVTRTAQDDDELPDFLAARIFAISDQLPSEQKEVPSIEKLIKQIKLYDTYGQTGYLGMGVSSTILEKTIIQIETLLGEKS